MTRCEDADHHNRLGARQPGDRRIWGPLVDALGRDDVVRLSPPGFGALLPEDFSATYLATCGAEDSVVACTIVKQYGQNHGDRTSTRTGFVLSPQGSWTFRLPRPATQVDVPAEKLTRDPPKR